MIVRSETTIGEIGEVIAKIEEATMGVPEKNLLMACLSIVILMQVPRISAQELADAVLKTSQWISMYLDQLSPDPTPKGMVH
jgi:hypothetical protein